MFTASNSLSFVRIPLAFLFLSHNPFVRILAITLAMVTDSIDGYVARKNNTVSRLGVILDPASDKFFVYFCLATLFMEQKLALWEIGAMLSRDFFLCLFTFVMVMAGKWGTFNVRSIRWGKVTTALQFIVLISIILGFTFPWYIYTAFLVFGWLAFRELFEARTSTG